MKTDASTFLEHCGFNAKSNPFMLNAALKADGHVRHYLVQSMKQGIGGNQKEIVETNETALCIIHGEKDSATKYIISNKQAMQYFGINQTVLTLFLKILQIISI